MAERNKFPIHHAPLATPIHQLATTILARSLPQPVNSGFFREMVQALELLRRADGTQTQLQDHRLTLMFPSGQQNGVRVRMVLDAASSSRRVSIASTMLSVALSVHKSVLYRRHGGPDAHVHETRTCTRRARARDVTF
jgi:hypothetical protein